MTRSHATHSAANFASVTSDNADRKKKAIIAIKTKQRQLNMDQDTYVAMLKARTGHSSCTLCSVHQLGLVNEYLSSLGAVNPKGVNGDGRRRLTPTADKAALHTKVKALLLELARVTGTPFTMAYADAICSNNQWCTRVDFADAHILHQLVGALSRTLRAKQHKSARAAS